VGPKLQDVATGDMDLHIVWVQEEPVRGSSEQREIAIKVKIETPPRPRSREKALSSMMNENKDG